MELLKELWRFLTRRKTICLPPIKYDIANGIIYLSPPYNLMDSMSQFRNTISTKYPDSIWITFDGKRYQNDELTSTGTNMWKIGSERFKPLGRTTIIMLLQLLRDSGMEPTKKNLLGSRIHTNNKHEEQ